MRVETDYQYQKMIKELEHEPVIALDTETVGKTSFDLFNHSSRVTRRGLPRTLSKLFRLQHVYHAQYKGRSRQVSAYLKVLEVKVSRGEALSKILFSKAVRDPSGLHFYNNYLGMVQIATSNKVYLIRAQNFTRGHWHALELILNRCLVLIVHNAQFDWKQLREHAQINLTCHNLHDSYIAERLLTNGTGLRCGLKDTLARRFGIEMSKEARVSNWLGEWTPEMEEYACADVTWLFNLKDVQRRELVKAGLMETYRLERRLLPINASMEMNGIAVDLSYIDQIKSDLTIEVRSLEKKGKSALGIDNLNSNVQVLASLQQAGVKCKDTNAKTLKMYEDNPLVQTLLEYRKASKLLGTYFNSFGELAVEGRIYANFNPNGTDTGRWSSSHPNFQNLPAKAEYRRLVVAKPGFVLVQADTSQIELRILAEVSLDPVLLEAFDTGQDVHLLAASLVFGKPVEAVTKAERSKCKAVGFGIIYGLSGFGLGIQLGISEDEAQRLIDAYMRNFYRVQKWIESAKEFVRTHGYAETLGGRRRYFDDIHSSDAWKVRAAERAGVNMVIQGTAADGLKQSIIELKLPYPSKLVGCFHDEILVESERHRAHEVSYLVHDAIIKGYTKYIKRVKIEIGSVDNGFKPLIINHWGEAK